MNSIYRDYVTADERLAAASYHRMQLSRAVAFLGDRYRGRPSCRHVYTNSRGERIDVSAITGRELSRVQVLEVQS